jgi:hypothetical protein
MSKNASLGAYGIMYVVQNKKSDVLGLLLRNGVVVPSDASDLTIAMAVTNLLKVSKSFYNDFSKLLVNPDVIYGMSSNMSGSYSNMSGYSNAIGDSAFCQDKSNKQFFPSSYKSACEGSSTFDTSIFNTTTKDTKDTKDTKPKKEGSGWLNQGLGLLQEGFAGYLQLDDNKTKRELANASMIIAQSGGTTIDGTPPPKGLSTGAIVGISLLGVTVVGLIIYVITKKK